MGTIVTFGLSGLWHELLIGVPMWNVFEENIFGMVTAYFLIQGVGLLVERRFLRNNLLVRRVWTWAIVILPVPMMINRGTQLVFHLTLP